MKLKISDKTVFVFCLSVYSFLFFTSCTKTNVPPSQSNSNSIKSIIANSTNATLLNTAISEAGLDSVYMYSGTFTFFAATDQAFLAAGITSYVLSNLPQSQLKRIILYNTLVPAVVSSRLPLGPDAPVQSYSGDTVFITNNASGLFINGIPVLSVDLLASNGIIDAVSKLVLPPTGTILQTAQADTSFSFFDTAVARTSAGETNIGNVLSNGNIYTLFLPDNNAFRGAGYATVADINAADPDTLAKVLLYHILPKRIFTSDFLGQTQQTLLTNQTVLCEISDTTYVVKGNSNTNPISTFRSNIMAYNGVIHVIDQFLKP